MQEKGTEDFKQLLPLINNKMVRCSNGNEATSICTSDNCSQHAFICIQTQCQCATKQHKQCSNIVSINDFLQGFEKQKQTITLDLKELFDSVIDDYNEIIESASQDRLQFMEYIQRFGLSRQMMQMVHNINEGITDKITGKQINDILKQMLSNNASYFPLKLDKFDQIRFKSIQIECTLNKIAYQYAYPGEKRKIAINKYGQSYQSLTKSIIQYKSDLYFIPKQLSALKSMRTLSLNYNNIHKIQNLQQFTNLMTLQLKKNQIKQIEGLDSLINLQILRLNSNHIKKIEGLEKLINLKSLNLSQNEISVIENLDKLKKLQILCLSNNKIDKLDNIDVLKSLIELELHGNPFMSIPQERAKIQQIKQINKNMQRNKRKATFQNLFGF